jgi:hypothetical protein
MSRVTTESDLQRLRANDRLEYHGVKWQVKEYSTYTDDKGYETEEWLLKSLTGKEYFLLREVDPEDVEAQVHWFLAEGLRHPAIYEPQSSRDLVMSLAQEMRSHKTPYPQLKMHNRVYHFESETEGDYESDGEIQTRITWDYWDESELWNLALEAWTNNTLVVYSTREVQVADFTDIHKYGSYEAPAIAPARSWEAMSNRNQQMAIAWIITILGFFFMLIGI